LLLAGSVLIRNFFVSSMSTCISANGMAVTPKCMKILSRVPNATLKGWKKAQISVSSISVVRPNNIKGLLRP